VTITSSQALGTAVRLLHGRPLQITTPQNQACRITFVVPAHNERADRVAKLLLSLAAQDVPPGTIEAITVVNNKPDAPAATLQRNQELLDSALFSGRTPQIFDEFRHHMPSYAIDMSSPGLAFPGSNVGMARQRGLLEAAIRFAERGVNGLVVHTDADCWFDDRSFVSKLLWLFDNYPDILLLGGEFVPVIDRNDPESTELLRHLPAYRRYCLYDDMVRDIRRGKVGLTKPLRDIGNCIAHRAFEGIAVGGIPDLSCEEDSRFCARLNEYAKAHNLRYERGSDWGLRVQAAFRLSDRAKTDVARERLPLLNGDDTMVDDPFNPGQQVLLDDTLLARLQTEVRKLPKGPERLEFLFVRQPFANFQFIG
jgi:hypothetical protein